LEADDLLVLLERQKNEEEKLGTLGGCFLFLFLRFFALQVLLCFGCWSVLLARQSYVFFSLMKKCPKHSRILRDVSFPLLVQYGGKGQAGAAQGKQECCAYQNSLWGVVLCAVWGGLRVVFVSSQRGF
jgi:hypothetical protein